MHALRLRCREEDYELLLAELYGLGTEGVTERDEPGGWRSLEAFFAERFETGEAFAPFSPEWRDVDGGSSTSAEFEPLLVGERFFLVPAGRQDATPPGRLRLTVHARQASGSGYQPATQLALIALERAAAAAGGERGPFFDVGTGSGILSAAASLLGLAPRYACDLDPVALAEARENGTPAALFAGSARAVAAGRMGLVAANLNAESILSLRNDLVRVTRPGSGRLILSGFTERNLARVLEAFPDCEPEAVLADGNWRAVTLTRTSLQ